MITLEDRWPTCWGLKKWLPVSWGTEADSTPTGALKLSFQGLFLHAHFIEVFPCHLLSLVSYHLQPERSSPTTSWFLQRQSQYLRLEKLDTVRAPDSPPPLPSPCNCVWPIHSSLSTPSGIWDFGGQDTSLDIRLGSTTPLPPLSAEKNSQL